MEILVNQEPLSFSLESEKALGQVIDGIADWLREGQLAITAIDVDNRTLPIHDRTAWQDLDVEDVNRLSVEAFPLTQVEQITLAAIADYCVLLQRALEDHDQAPLSELVQELPYVRARLVEFFPSLGADAQGSEILSCQALEDGEVPAQETAMTLTGELQSIETIIESRLREYADPFKELALTLGQLTGFKDALIRVPIQLQTGDDTAAMSTVVTLTELLSRVIRLLPLAEAVPAEPGAQRPLSVGDISNFALELTPFLRQLQEAFEVQDGVLIGDLLEYEIAPRLQALPTLLDGNSNQTTENRSE